MSTQKSQKEHNYLKSLLAKSIEKCLSICNDIENIEFYGSTYSADGSKVYTDNWGWGLKYEGSSFYISKKDNKYFIGYGSTEISADDEENGIIRILKEQFDERQRILLEKNKKEIEARHISMMETLLKS